MVPGEPEVIVVALTGWIVIAALVVWEDASGAVLVVMFLGVDADVAVVVVVDTWAEVARMDGEMAPVVVLDLAWNVGLLRARKAEKKLAKKGR